MKITIEQYIADIHNKVETRNHLHNNVNVNASSLLSSLTNNRTRCFQLNSNDINLL